MIGRRQVATVVDGRQRLGTCGGDALDLPDPTAGQAGMTCSAPSIFGWAPQRPSSGLWTEMTDDGCKGGAKRLRIVALRPSTAVAGSRRCTAVWPFMRRGVACAASTRVLLSF